MSKNKPTCENAVSQTLYGSCSLRVMGSCPDFIPDFFPDFFLDFFPDIFPDVFLDDLREVVQAVEEELRGSGYNIGYRQMTQYVVNMTTNLLLAKKPFLSY